MIPERATYSGQSYKLYDDYNEIHVFVEDKGFENLYKVLFKKYGVRIENIFSRNGKEAILEEAKSCKDPKCIFLVDRDWSDLLGTMPTLKNVVVLSMHSIESYLIDYNAFSGIVICEHPRGDIDSLLNEEHFEEILVDISEKLRPLFECFVAMQMCAEKKRGCSYEPGHFQQKNSSCEIDVKEVKKFIADSNVLVPQSVKDYFSDRLLNKKGHGKYILHYLWEGARRRTKISKIGIEKLMMRLAHLIDTSDLELLASEVKSRSLCASK